MAKRKKLTADKARTAIASVIDGKLTANELARLMDKIEKEEGAKAVINAYVQLAEFVIPKLSRTESIADTTTLTIESIIKNVNQAPDQLPHIDNELPQISPNIDKIPSELSE